MLSPANPYELNCPSREILDLIGGKWAVLILCSLQAGPVRTGDLMRGIGGVSQKMLSQTLRDLRENGLVERISYHEVPPRVDYRLTALGRSLSEVVRALEQWVVLHYPRMIEHRTRSRTS